MAVSWNGRVVCRRPGAMAGRRPAGSTPVRCRRVSRPRRARGRSSRMPGAPRDRRLPMLQRLLRTVASYPNVRVVSASVGDRLQRPASPHGQSACGSERLSSQRLDPPGRSRARRRLASPCGRCTGGGRRDGCTVSQAVATAAGFGTLRAAGRRTLLARLPPQTDKACLALLPDTSLPGTSYPSQPRTFTRETTFGNFAHL